jgi:hypothetical protein
MCSSLVINPENGHIVGYKKALQPGQQEYEKGWKIKL